MRERSEKISTGARRYRLEYLFMTFAKEVFTVLLAASPLAFGQTDLCSGSSQPACVLSQVYGPNGLTLKNPFHEAHFQSAFQENFTALNSAIATQLASLPLISPASAFTYRTDPVAGFVPSSLSFGPIYTERAETMGRGKTYFGVAYQRFRFGTIDGIDLHDVPAVFSHKPNTGPNGSDPLYEKDFISTNNNVDLKIDQVVLFGTVGITDHLDASVAIPFLTTRITGISDATINRVAPPDPIFGQAHYFDPNAKDTSTHQVFRQSGDASGLGDVVFRVKYGIINNTSWRLAFVTDIRVPSGDERDFLGTGAVGIKPFVAVSLAKRVSPHFNVGYQINGNTVLAGNVSTGLSHHLANQFIYAVGADAALTTRVTLVTDFLGQYLHNAPRVFNQTFQAPPSQYFTATQFPAIGTGISSFSLNNGSVGVKCRLFAKLLLIGNVLFRADSNGLRQDVTPLISLAYAP